MKLDKDKNHDFTHMRTLRDKTDERKGRETNNIKTGRGTKHKRLKYGEQREGY